MYDKGKIQKMEKKDILLQPCLRIFKGLLCHDHGITWSEIKITFFLLDLKHMLLVGSIRSRLTAVTPTMVHYFWRSLASLRPKRIKILKRTWSSQRFYLGNQNSQCKLSEGHNFYWYVICFFSIISFFVVLWAFIMCIISSFRAIKFTWLDHLVLGLPGFLLPSTHPCMVTFSRQSPSLLTMWPFDSGWDTRDVFCAGPPESAQYHLIVEQKNLNLCRIMKDLIIAGYTRWKPGLITMSYM